MSSEDVVKAYIHRIGEVNGLINAVVEGRYAEAVKEARFADHLVRSGSFTEAQLAEQLPLLGVPFTAKEAILIKGTKLEEILTSTKYKCAGLRRDVEKCLVVIRREVARFDFGTVPVVTEYANLRPFHVIVKVMQSYLFKVTSK